MKARKPFYVSFDFIGIDSTGSVGLAANRDGDLFEVTTDQLGRGAFGAVANGGTVQNVTVTSCGTAPTYHVSYGGTHYLSCVPQPGNER